LPLNQARAGQSQCGRPTYLAQDIHLAVLIQDTPTLSLGGGALTPDGVDTALDIAERGVLPEPIELGQDRSTS
jgi:hypothetical protein